MAFNRGMTRGSIALLAGLALVTAVGAQCPPEFAPNVPILPGEAGLFVSLVEDLDEDGLLDVVSAYSSPAYFFPAEGTILWHERTGAGIASHERRPLVDSLMGVNSLHVVDFDGDDDLDVVGNSHSPDPHLFALLNDGEETTPFEEITLLEIEGAKILGVEDLDLDGDLDLLIAPDADASYARDISWVENVSLDPISPEFIVHTVLVDEMKAFRDVVDLDQDGDLDIIYSDFTNLYLLELTPGEPPTWKKRYLINAHNSYVVIPADLDGDGDLDLIRDRTGESLHWYENSGEWPPVFTGRLIESFDPWWVKGLAVGDLNSDGHLDIVANLYHSRNLSFPPYWEQFYERRIYFNSGHADPTFSGHRLSDNFGDVTVVDWDHDGDADLLTRTSTGPYMRENLSTLVICDAQVLDQDGDGLLQPSEPASFEVVLHNQTIHTFDGVTVGVGNSTPDLVLSPSTSIIGSVVSQERRSVLFPFTIPDTLACGASLEFVVDLTWDGGSASDEFTFRTGESVTYSEDFAESAPLGIPDDDPAGVEVSHTLSGFGGEITSMALDLNITHEYRGDLLVTLTGPGSEEVTVFDGDPLDPGEILTGPFDIDEFDGDLPIGTFTLKAVDRASGDIGSLNSWGLTVDYEMNVCLPWEPGPLAETIANALVGIAPMTQGMNRNDDSGVDAADVVTALQASP